METVSENCKHCLHYKKRGVGVGFCKEKTKIVKASAKEDCFMSLEEVKEVKEAHKKITIKNGKKIYS